MKFDWNKYYAGLLGILFIWNILLCCFIFYFFERLRLGDYLHETRVVTPKSKSSSDQWLFCLFMCRGYRAMRVGFHSLWHLKHQACGCEHTNTHTVHACRTDLSLSWKSWQAQSPAVLMHGCHHPEKNTMNISPIFLSRSISADLSVNTAALHFSPSFVTCVIICLFSKYLQLSLSLSTDISRSRCVSIFFPA